MRLIISRVKKGNNKEKGSFFAKEFNALDILIVNYLEAF